MQVINAFACLVFAQPSTSDVERSLATRRPTQLTTLEQGKGPFTSIVTYLMHFVMQG